MRIKSIAYDLDGTIISSQGIQDQGWREAARVHGIHFTEQMILDLRGISNDGVALALLPEEKSHLREVFIRVKKDYVLAHVREIRVFPEFLETALTLEEGGLLSWICTSASRYFVSKIFEVLPELNRFVPRTIWREMYQQPKPAGDCLGLTLQRMGLKPDDVLYAGDTFNDYLTARNAGVPFVCYCNDGSSLDSKFPSEVPVVRRHSEIIPHLQ